MRFHAANADTMQTRTVLAGTLLVALLLSSIAAAQDPIETVRIDSDLVDLKVSVLGSPPNTPPPALEPKDFVVLEDGVPQEISFFAAADTPFDLVLLLDLSGSNSKNLKMIRNSAKRFVDAARITEVIPIQTFDRHDHKVGCVLRKDVSSEISARNIGIRHFHSFMLIGRADRRPYADDRPL